MKIKVKTTWKHSVFCRLSRVTAVILVAFCVPLAGAELVDRVVAVVGGEIVTLSELREFSAQAPQVAQEKVLEMLIEQLLIEQEARRQGIEVTDAEVQVSIQSRMAQLEVSEEEFRRILESEGLTMEQFEEKIRSRLIQFKFVQQQIRGGIDISDEEMLNFYRLNQDMFSASARVHLAHIFLPFPMTRDIEQREGVRTLAAELHQRIINGEDFAEIAKSYSRGGDPSGGGDIGWLKPEEMIPAFQKAVEGLEAGEISEPFETGRGMHILQVIELKKSEVLPFEDVRMRIYAHLYDQRMQEELLRLVRELKDRTPIERKL